MLNMEKLKQVLAQGDTVLFVGSGISQWSGLPSWPQMIEELAKFVEASGESADLVRAEAQRGNLLQAASYGFYKLTKPQIGEFIRKACRYGVAKPHEIHRKLVSLGPRCFLTTNYDNLLEESLRIWQSDRFFPPPVTNRHLTELANIVHARAVDFVFKPHGDAGDSDSIILTREQYRQLLEGGERHAALESVKMLLASRPVVYVGFGLQDPDFIYLRDLLANTYKGGTRDHYAIMADVLEAEVDYWRSSYGIHLVSYSTAERADKPRDHSALLKLLDDLHAAAPPIAIPCSAGVAEVPCPPDMILALARHAGRLTRAPRSNPEFPIRVHPEEGRRRNELTNSRFYEFYNCPVEKFLDEGPPRALLIGLPGSGKSYSLQRAAARFAERLHESCLSETFDEKPIVIPLFADFKLYHGNLDELINGTLPSGLSLDKLTQRFKVKIYLDSFNEMPREYWESGSYEADFSKFVEKHADASIIIGSRTNDGLSKMEFPSYSLDEIDEKFVAAELEHLKIDIGGRFEHEIRRLLQKPFYFQLVASRAVKLPVEAHPRDFYQTFFSALTRSFEERFSRPFNLERALSLAAYDAINGGQEAQPLEDVLQVLRTQLQSEGVVDVYAQDVANWLVSKAVIIPYRGRRVAFFHQSVTEYLAAGELARRYRASPHILKEKLSLTRWDQCLLLTLSLLPPDEGAAFLQDVVNADLALALNATKYLESGRDEVVAKLLLEIPSRRKGTHAAHLQDLSIELAVEHGAAISDAHEPQLRALVKCGDSIGAAAAARLVELKGTSVKDELLQSLVEARDDFNYCNWTGRALGRFAAHDDVERMVALADSVQGKISPDGNYQEVHGFITGTAAFLKEVDLQVIRQRFLPKDESEPLSTVRAAILCEILEGHHSTAALELAGELLTRGVGRAATSLFFISEFAKPKDHWPAPRKLSRNEVESVA